MFISTRPSWLGSAALVLLLLAAAPATADVISPDEAACQGKAEGAACDADGTKGTCQPAECCKLDYSQGTPPKSVCGPCLRCKDGGSDAGSDTAIGGDDTAPSTGTTTSSDAGGSCNAAGTGLPPWTLPGLMLGAGALLWLRRRTGTR